MQPRLAIISIRHTHIVSQATKKQPPTGRTGETEPSRRNESAACSERTSRRMARCRRIRIWQYRCRRDCRPRRGQRGAEPRIVGRAELHREFVVASVPVVIDCRIRRTRVGVLSLHMSSVADPFLELCTHRPLTSGLDRAGCGKVVRSSARVCAWLATNGHARP